jgi:Replication-relaxation
MTRSTTPTGHPAPARQASTPRRASTILQPSGPPAGRSRQRRAVTAELVGELAGRLTGRDRWVLAMLAEHRVLTTGQLTALGFTTARKAERRLAQLWAWRCIDRFRPYLGLGRGSAAYHWILDDAGAAILAAAHGITVRELGHHRGAGVAIAHSQRLDHTVGTNTVLTALATTPTVGGSGVVVWWGERRCAAAWGDLVRPDAAAVWRTPTGARLAFAVEYDTGTEPLTRVAGKLADYADLAAALGRHLPVLFALTTLARETALHQMLDPGAVHPGGGRLRVATAAAEHAAAVPAGPAGPVWRPAAPAGQQQRGSRRRGGGRAARVSLDQLAAAWPAGGTLPVAALDVGLGWPAPPPRPPQDSGGVSWSA